MTTTPQDQQQNAKERLVADQSAHELAPLLSVDERAFVSILATAEIHQLDAKQLIRCYAEEVGSNAKKELAEQISPGVHPLDAAGKINNVMPTSCKVALSSNRASGSLNAFYRSWLALSFDDRSNWVRHEHTNAAVLGRLGIRVLVCTWLLSFILLFIIPEHQKMYEEFGLEYNSTMRTFMWMSAWLAKVLPLLSLFLTCVFLYVIFFRRSILQNYIRRWLPGRWRQVSLPKPILRRKLLAWDLLAFRGENKLTESTDWDELVRAKAISSHEANVMKGVESRETQAWLLRNMADEKDHRRKRRFSLGVNLFSLVFQLGLAAIIILATFTIFTMLIKLLEDLSRV